MNRYIYRSGAQVIIDPVSMLIAVDSHKFPSVDMFCLTLLKIGLNAVPATVVIGICSRILSEPVYNALVGVS